MKKISLSTLFLFSILISAAQNFEGKIVYSNSYKSNNDKVSSEQWNKMLGDKQDYFIKNGNYKSVTNGSFFQWQLYINKENKLYSKTSNSKVAVWSDPSVNTDEITKTEINKNVITVLGYKCDEIIFTCKSGVQKYYFSRKLAADPKLFIHHQLGNWYAYLVKTNALPLKSIIETSEFTLETVATEIIPMKLEDSLFEIPAGIKTEKSAY